MRLFTAISLFLYFGFGQLFCQSTSDLWSIQTHKSVSRQDWVVQPEECLQASFDFNYFYTALLNNDQPTLTISVPNPDGVFKNYVLAQHSVFSAELQQKYPGYYSFYGSHITDSEEKIALSISPFGIHVMVMERNGQSFFIDPPVLHSDSQYIIYYKNKLVPNKTKKWFCKIPEKIDTEIEEITKDIGQTDVRAGDCRLRTYRLALACTGEYGLYHGGTVEKVLASYNTAVTRINGVYRNEVGIFFVLVDNLEKIIFFNPATDPYTNNDSGTMLSQNQTTVDQQIGRNNYDIGHVFGTGEGGIASIGSVCGNRKAQGVTGRPNPVGDAFFIDYVAHEIGHQFRANHTQNNSCQRNNSTAVEPGSGSTIMGYAGICPPDVQNNSNAYFHSISLFEIASFVSGQTCGILENPGNSKPLLSVTKNLYTIPVSTSFFLTAKGSDTDDDNLTYNWEQMNSEIATMPPRATSVEGPMFRSVPPTSNPTRYFPDLKAKYGQWEVLPSVSRQMSFRCTVRDNNNLVGCSNELTITVGTNVSAGPFVVSNPNTPSVVWQTGTTAAVAWNVANTDQAPISCSLVDIYLSTDGGISYPILIAKEVPNTGSAMITVPNHPTNLARVMVIASGNIFYDVSNFSFSIISSFNYTIEDKNREICGDTLIFPVQLTSLGSNLNHKIYFDLIEAPANVLVYFPDTLNSLPASDSIFVVLESPLEKGIHQIIFKVTDPPYIIFDTLYVLSRGNDIEPLTLLLPENGKNFPNSTLISLLEWESDVVQDYTLQISTSPSFHDSITNNLVLNRNLYLFFAKKELYFWRVKVNSSCLELPWSDVSVFNFNGKPKYTEPLLRNNALIVEKGQNKIISGSHLDIAYEETEPFNFIIVETPKYGEIFKIINGQPTKLISGDTFNTEDIRNEKITYQHLVNEATTDRVNLLIKNEETWLAPIYFEINILQDNLFNGHIEIKQDILCFGEKGILQIFIENGTPPYQYVLNGGEEYNILTNNEIEVGPDVYTITIRDGNLNEVNTNTVFISEPALLTNTTVLDGYNLVILSNGGAGFTREYSFDGVAFSPSNTLISAPNQTYITVVKDVNACLAYDTIEIFMNELKFDSIVFAPFLLCPYDSVGVAPYISGGIPPYELSINGIAIQDSVPVLTAGQYIISVKDSGDKIITDTITITSPETISAHFTIEKRNVTWFVTGGISPYMYSFDKLLFSTDTFSFDLANGYYTLYIKDQNECIFEESFVINVLQSVHLNIEHPPCYGETGSINISTENGTSPFLFGLDLNSLDSSQYISGLTAGAYTLYVTDALNDTIVEVFEIIQPDSLEITFMVNSDTLVVLASGGTPPYLYSVDNGFAFFEFYEFYGVPKGIYNVIVKDSNGCLQEAEVEIIYSSTKNFNNAQSVSVYPNPVTQSLTLISNEISLDGMEMLIFDITGKKMRVNELQKGKNRATFDMGHLPTGTYILLGKGDQNIFRVTFIKI